CGRAAAWAPHPAAVYSATAQPARRTTRSAPPPPPSRTATPESADRCAPRSRGRTPAAGRALPPPDRPAGRQEPPGASFVHLERCDLLAAALQLDHEDPVDRRRKVERHAPALPHVLVEVVAVDVNLIGHVGMHGEADGLSLLHRDLLNPALRL